MSPAGKIGAATGRLTNPTTTRVAASKDPDIACTFAQSWLLCNRSGTSVAMPGSRVRNRSPPRAQSSKNSDANGGRRRANQEQAVRGNARHRCARGADVRAGGRHVQREGETSPPDRCDRVAVPVPRSRRPRTVARRRARVLGAAVASWPIGRCERCRLTATQVEPPYDDLIFHCVGTLKVKRGQITLQGLIEVQGEDDSGPFTVAITGGTGRYEGAGGKAVIRQVSPTRSVYRLRFTSSNKHHRK